MILPTSKASARMPPRRLAAIPTSAVASRLISCLPWEDEPPECPNDQAGEREPEQREGQADQRARQQQGEDDDDQDDDDRHVADANEIDTNVRAPV